jgi:hypothetical protein
MYSTLLFYTVGVFTVAYVLGGQTLDFADKATELKNWQVNLPLMICGPRGPHTGRAVRPRQRPSSRGCILIVIGNQVMGRVSQP